MKRWLLLAAVLGVAGCSNAPSPAEVADVRRGCERAWERQIGAPDERPLSERPAYLDQCVRTDLERDH